MLAQPRVDRVTDMEGASEDAAYVSIQCRFVTTEGDGGDGGSGVCTNTRELPQVVRVLRQLTLEAPQDKTRGSMHIAVHERIEGIGYLRQIARSFG